MNNIPPYALKHFGASDLLCIFKADFNKMKTLFEFFIKYNLSGLYGFKNESVFFP